MISINQIIRTEHIGGGLWRVSPYILALKRPADGEQAGEQAVEEIVLWIEFSATEPTDLGEQPPIDKHQTLDLFRSLPLLKVVFSDKSGVMYRAVCVRYHNGTILKQQIDNGWLWTVVPPNL